MKRILFLCSCHKYDYNINREKSKEEKRGKREKRESDSLNSATKRRLSI